jgi:Flp pilus assembly protein TadB
LGHHGGRQEDIVTLFLLLVIIAVALGLIGVLIKGLFYLLIIGIVIFVLGLFIGRRRFGKRRTKRSPR